MRVQVDPVGQGSPLRMQLESGGLRAVASVKDDRRARLRDSMMNKAGVENDRAAKLKL